MGQTLLNEALTAFKSLDHQAGVADAHLSLGVLAMLEGDYDDAMIRYKKAESIYQSLDQHDARAEAIHQQGVLAQLQGAPAEARRLFQRASDLRAAA